MPKPRTLYIPPKKGQIVGRPSVQSKVANIPADQALNYRQFANTLLGTHEEILIGLVNRFLAGFHGTLEQWKVELNKLASAKI